ncbi:MAG: glycosyltransferase family 4 protein [Acidobacteria bacterium]|nr:glycosyltransferase family 4 protein [Acidobacteriota bacterium]
MSDPIVVIVDVTDTLSSPWSAGIQRVVRGVTAALAARSDVELVPVVRVEGSQRVRTLVGDEPARLARPPAGERPPMPTAAPRPWLEALDRSVPAGAMRAARAVVRPLRALQYRARDERRRLSAERRHHEVILGRVAPGTVVLELDAVWNQVGVDRRRWYRDLQRQGARIVPFVHDLLPIEHPDWFVPSLVAVFTDTLDTQLAAADLVVTNSSATADSVRRLAASLDRSEVPVVPVVLGADRADRADESRVPGPADTAEVARVVLVVGTIEPRKNHRTLLQAWDRLRADGTATDAELVVVGRPGWRADDVVEQLEAGADHGIRWLSGADDEELVRCYQQADLVVVPSLTEGYGLPVVEALRAGVPVVSSSGGALAALGERAPVAVELVEPTDVDGWVDAIRRHLVDPAHRVRALAAVADADVPTWGDTAEELVAALRASTAIRGEFPTGGANQELPS